MDMKKWMETALDTKSEVLGIDPGLANTGLAVVSRQKRSGRFVVETVETLRTPKKDSEAVRLLSIYRAVSERIATDNIAAVAIERVFFGENVSSCISTAQVIGVIQLTCAQAGVAVLFATPQQLKRSVGCKNNAPKADVKRFVEALTKRRVKTHHEADAIAAAIFGHLHTCTPAQNIEPLKQTHNR